MNSAGGVAHVAAGATAISVSLGQSLHAHMPAVQIAENLYGATIQQLLNGHFDVVVSDVLGIVSVSVLVANLTVNLLQRRRARRQRGE